jgi:hypothetical protein
LAVWNEVPTSSITLVRGGDVSTSAVQARDAQSSEAPPPSPMVICDPHLSTTLGSPGSPQDTNFIPAVTASRATNLRIDYSYLLLNAESGKDANIANLSDTQLAIVIAHEMGHVLGLGHATDPIPLMYFDATDKRVLRLAQDDRDGITFLYPRLEIGRNGMFGCGTIAAVGSGGGSRGGGGPAGLAVIVGFAAVATWLFRRRAHIKVA